MLYTFWIEQQILWNTEHFAAQGKFISAIGPVVFEIFPSFKENIYKFNISILFLFM